METQVKALFPIPLLTNPTSQTQTFKTGSRICPRPVQITGGVEVVEVEDVVLEVVDDEVEDDTEMVVEYGG